MKLSDYVIDFIDKQNVKHIFLITGGAIAHLVDSIGKNHSVRYICNQHEQASAMAADAYSRITGNIGVAMATSGPGATNLITGICCSFFDSIPSLFITGQVATFRLSEDLGVRQNGFQETDITNIVRPITKYSVLIKDPNLIRYELEKSLYIAKTGRPGPVLIDIPDNIQRETINPDEILRFTSPVDELDLTQLEALSDKALAIINESKRPVVILGNGVTLSKSADIARQLIQELGFPVLLSWAAMDILPYNHKLRVGGFGLTGSRFGNFTVQNSDMILSIGSRLDSHATGTPVNTFGRGAKKIIVDIDEKELNKFKKANMNIELPINCDVRVFMQMLYNKKNKIFKKDISAWLNQIASWKHKYPLYSEKDYEQVAYVNAYIFIKKLSDKLNDDEIIVVDTGESLPQIMNTFEIKKRQRIFSAFNNTPMGYSLAASIGACYANNEKRVICISGDGGFQINIQELATIAKYKLPIKIFIFNNRGYNMIKETQNQWLDSVYHASSEEMGIATPDFVSIATSYGISAQTISNNKEIDEKLAIALSTNRPFLINLEISPKPDFLTTKFGRPIEDISPCLNREEFIENMIVPALDISKNLRS